MRSKRGSSISRLPPRMSVYSENNVFNRLVTHARTAACIHKNISSAFEATGIWPFNL
jgi:hypothetical protein